MVNKLRYLLAVAETQNLRQAAQLLGVSPPALSKALKSLEEEFAFPILISHGRGIVLSDQAKVLADRSVEVIRLVDGLKDKTPKQQALVLKLSTFEVFSTYFLRTIFTGGLSEYALELREAVPGEMEENILTGLSDFAITYLPVPRAGVKHTEVSQIEMGVYGKEGALQKLPFNELPFVVPILPNQGSPSKVQGLDGWPDSEYERKIRYQVTLMESALELCRNGLAVSYIPKFVAQLQNEKRTREHALVEFLNPYKMKNRFSVYIAHRNSTAENAPFRMLARAMRETRAKQKN